MASTRHPLALLPVRIETRFFDVTGGVELRVRIFPDQIHIDSHEPELTDREHGAHERWLASTRDLAAWRELVHDVGGRRASYLATLSAADRAAAGTRAATWTRPAQARLLPARWTVLATPETGTPAADRRLRVRATSQPITGAFVVGTTPRDGVMTASDAELALGPDAAWLTGFDDAERRGMAVRIAIPPSLLAFPLTVSVFGLPDPAAADAAATGARELVAALAHHRFTDGLGILDHGMPTNDTSDEPPAWSSIAARPEATFARDAGAPLVANGDGSAADTLGRALGIGAAAFDRVDGSALAAADLDRDAAAIQSVLWPATIGYFLDQMLDGAVPRDHALLETVRRLYVDRVRNRGPLPVVRVGRQPYGVLPVTSLARWRPVAGDGVDARVVDVVARIVELWQRSAAQVPRLGADGDRAELLTQILALAPVATSYDARSVLGPVYTTYLHDLIRVPLASTWWDRQRAIASHGWTAARLPATAHRLARAVFAAEDVPLAMSITGDGPSDAPLPFFVTLGAADLAALRATPHLGARTPLVYALARHGLLCGYLAAARAILEARGDRGPFLDPEIIGVPAGDEVVAIDAPWTWLDRPFAPPASETIGQALQRLRGDAPVPAAALADVYRGLARLAATPAARVDALVREALDLCSHRVDAWATAIATSRLHAMRAANPTGVLVGGYGWVERLRREVVPAAPAIPDEPGSIVESTLPGGFVHAPSLGHATTAAVLRSGYLAHGGSAGSALAIDLSSAHARVARDVLDGLRAGRSLGATLGRRFERELADVDSPPLGQLIPVFRRFASIADHELATDAMREARVTDGHAIVRDRQTIPWGTRGLPAHGSPQQQAIGAILERLAVVLDATADLVVAESVHQLTAGTTAGASSILDLAAGVAPPPRELDVLEQPVAGLGLEHRILALVPAAVTPSVWSATPRAAAEPALEAWCAALLGEPTEYLAHVVYREPGASAVPRSLSLAELGIAAIDVVLGVGDLAARVLDHASANRPAGVSDAATVELATGGTLDHAIVLADTLARAIRGARPAKATDLGASTADPDAVAVDALATRLADGSSIDTALAHLASDPRRGLLDATALGVAGAVPAIDATRWPAQVEAATVALRARQDRLVRLGTPGPTRETQIAHHVARLHALVGDDVPILAPFTLPARDAERTAAAIADQATLLGDTRLEDWLEMIGRVRAGAGAFADALLLRDAVTPDADSARELRVVQWPRAASERWIGTPTFSPAIDAAGPIARASALLHLPSGTIADAAAIAGLVLDAWSEVIAAPRHTSAVSFQHDQPGARAPQAILVAVPPDDQPEWTDDLVEAILDETIGLVHVRPLDPETVSDAGHYLPALYFALNLAGDTAAVDFFPEQP